MTRVNKSTRKELSKRDGVTNVTCITLNFTNKGSINLAASTNDKEERLTNITNNVEVEEKDQNHYV